MVFSEVRLHEVTYLGGDGFPFGPGEQIDAHFEDGGVILYGRKRTARFTYFELVELTVAGPGTVTTGGGFVGGGFGVEGALEGMAVASILNAVTTKTKNHTFITLVANFGELHLHYSGMEPGALRVVLSSVFRKMRQSSPEWIKSRMFVLEAARSLGQIDDHAMEEMTARLGGSPRWPDPEAEELLRKQEAAERQKLSTENGPKGTCPNCDHEISIFSETCPQCKAVFGAGSAWKVKPLFT